MLTAKKNKIQCLKIPSITETQDCPRTVNKEIPCHDYKITTRM